MLSDGKDSGPTDFRRRYVSQVDVIDRARDEEVMIYAVAMRSRSTQRMPPGIGAGGLAALTADLPDPGLARVAEETGGGYFELSKKDELGPTFTRVVQELHSQYVLGFSPAVLDGKIHKLEVRVKRPGLTARSRRSYVATPAVPTAGH